MITNSFDDKSEAIISPKSFFGEQKKMCDISIGTFSGEIYTEVLKLFSHEQVGEIRAANRNKPIHRLTVGEQQVIF